MIQYPLYEPTVKFTVISARVILANQAKYLIYTLVHKALYEFTFLGMIQRKPFNQKFSVGQKEVSNI